MQPGQLNEKLEKCKGMLESTIDNYKEENGIPSDEKVYSTQYTANPSGKTDDFLYNIISARSKIVQALKNNPNAHKKRLSIGEALRYLEDVETEAKCGDYFGNWRSVVEELIRCQEFLKQEEKDRQEDTRGRPPQQDNSQQHNHKRILDRLRSKLNL